METKFDFNESSEQPNIKKNAEGLLTGIIIFLKSILSFHKDVDKNSTVNAIKADISMKGTTAWILICSILIASVGLNAELNASSNWCHVNFTTVRTHSWAWIFYSNK